jgi:hypothetical protein
MWAPTSGTADVRGPLTLIPRTLSVPFLPPHGLYPELQVFVIG